MDCLFWYRDVAHVYILQFSFYLSYKQVVSARYQTNYQMEKIEQSVVLKYCSASQETHRIIL